MASALPLLVLAVFSLAQAQIRVFDLRASDLPSDLLGTTDGYVKVFIGKESLGKTSVRNDNKHPWWEEEFQHFNAQENDTLKLEVYDSDILFDDLLGVCQRQVRKGTYSHDCFLEKGGTLHYSYTLR
uniref:C2 domain-containing protein n=1 Tax=Tetraodon nigroviridis TaxID=99883 RepID=H3C4E6_TETNG